MNNGEFWIASAIRLGFTNNRDIYPEVSSKAVCKKCRKAVGPSVVVHAFTCPKASRRGRNLRHTAVKSTLVTIERCAVPGTHVIPEPNVVAATGAIPTDAQFAKSRADLFVRLPDGSSYIVDITVVDATLGSKPINTPYEAGKATEQAFNDKMKQYSTTRFTGIDPKMLRMGAWDLRGGPSKSTLNYLKEIKHRESHHYPKIPRSVIACRIYQRTSVAIQRAIAYNVMEYRYVGLHVPRPLAAMPVAG